MKLTAIKRLVEEKKMHMEVIVNNKVRDNVSTSSTLSNLICSPESLKCFLLSIDFENIA